MATIEFKTNVVIHTNTFADSFASELCAYMTGEVANQYDHDDLPGVKEAKEFAEDPTIPQKFKDSFSCNVEEVQGEYGPQYYETIATPGWFNHGMGQIYEDTPQNEVIALADYKKVSIEYANSHYVGSELKEELDEINSLKKVHKYGSEQGVWITLDIQLDQEHIEFLKNRAYQFAEKNDIKILSFEIDEVKMQIKKTVTKLM